MTLLQLNSSKPLLAFQCSVNWTGLVWKWIWWRCLVVSDDSVVFEILVECIVVCDNVTGPNIVSSQRRHHHRRLHRRSARLEPVYWWLHQLRTVSCPAVRTSRHRKDHFSRPAATAGISNRRISTSPSLNCPSPSVGPCRPIWILLSIAKNSIFTFHFRLR